MHAATKPQTLGLILVAAGVELSLRTGPRSAPWSSSRPCSWPPRRSRRTWSAHGLPHDQVRHDLLARDDLADDLAAAGFHLGIGAPEDEPTA